jgi:hypothetical protein
VIPCPSLPNRWPAIDRLRLDRDIPRSRSRNGRQSRPDPQRSDRDPEISKALRTENKFSAQIIVAANSLSPAVPFARSTCTGRICSNVRLLGVADQPATPGKISAPRPTRAIPVEISAPRPATPSDPGLAGSRRPGNPAAGPGLWPALPGSVSRIHQSRFFSMDSS